ncbi:MAG: transposase [Clostridiales bacterium]|nr:transposase [Clostridiales bacterium]
MSKKNKKSSAVEKELIRRIEMYRNPLFDRESLQGYCEIIKKQAYDDFDDCSYINFNESEQYSPSGLHQFTEAVAIISPIYSDTFWIKAGEGDTLDAETYIGTIKDPMTYLPKTRAFLRRKIEETGEYILSELESIHTVALTKYNFSSDNDEAYNVTVNYALITCFINSIMIELDFYEAPSVNIIKEFISDISADLNANPEKRIKDMPKKETFMELMAKLNILKENTPLPLTIEENDIFGDSKADRSHYKKFDKAFKIETVKRIKENQLSVAQVSKELGIHNSGIHHWIRDYEKHGENAFRGRGRVSPNKRNIIDKLFQDESAEAATTNTNPGTGTNEYSILNLPRDNGKMMESCSYKLRKYDKEFKIATVKRIKENQLPVLQVSEKLGIDSSALNRWIHAYDELGENAFQGSGRKSHSNPNMDAPAQNESIEAAIPCTDSAHEKKKNAVSGSHKKKTYDTAYKKAIVEYVTENNLSAFQVAKELNINYLNLNKWIRLYKKHGENAFPGSGVYYGDLELDSISERK